MIRFLRYCSGSKNPSQCLNFLWMCHFVNFSNRIQLCILQSLLQLPHAYKTFLAYRICHGCSVPPLCVPTSPTTFSITWHSIHCLPPCSPLELFYSSVYPPSRVSIRLGNSLKPQFLWDCLRPGCNQPVKSTMKQHQTLRLKKYPCILPEDLPPDCQYLSHSKTRKVFKPIL